MYVLMVLFIASLLSILPVTADVLRLIAVGIIAGAGIITLIPQLNIVLEQELSAVTNHVHLHSPRSGFLGGLMLGAAFAVVWTPCNGPIMTAVSSLASTNGVSLQLFMTAVLFGIGGGIPLFLVASIESWFSTHHTRVGVFTAPLQKISGIFMILTALMMFFKYDIAFINSITRMLPWKSSYYSALEKQAVVVRSLDSIREKGSLKKIFPTLVVNPEPTSRVSYIKHRSSLPLLYQAPEVVDIKTWLNTNMDVPSIAAYRGNVVLLDFWSFTCAACIPSIPQKELWLKKYKNFKIISIHIPSNAEARSLTGVKQAVTQYGVTYPVAIDANFSTFDAYHTNVLPSEYLIDAEGMVRYSTTDPDASKETERKIQTLLGELE